MDIFFKCLNNINTNSVFSRLNKLTLKGQRNFILFYFELEKWQRPPNINKQCSGDLVLL